MTRRRRSVAHERMLSAIAAMGAAAHGMAPADLVTGRRRGTRRTIFARQVAMYLAVVDLELLQETVGAFFLRGRTSVRHSVRVIEDRRDDPEFDRWVTELEEQIPDQVGRRGRELPARSTPVNTTASPHKHPTSGGNRPFKAVGSAQVFEIPRENGGRYWD